MTDLSWSLLRKKKIYHAPCVLKHRNFNQRKGHTPSQVLQQPSWLNTLFWQHALCPFWSDMAWYPGIKWQLEKEVVEESDDQSVHWQELIWFQVPAQPLTTSCVALSELIHLLSFGSLICDKAIGWTEKWLGEGKWSLWRSVWHIASTE